MGLKGCWWHWVGSDVGAIELEVTLVALGLKGRWCVPNMGVSVALGLEGRWCPQNGGC